MKRFLPMIALMMAMLTSILGLSLSPGSANARRVEKGSAPVTDLVVDAIEITQSMQDLNNSVPLVEAKRTFVRVYAHSTNGIYPTTATLTAVSGSLSQTLLPIPPGGPFINVRPTYNRQMSSHAFLFELPLWATFVDELTLTAQINPDLRWHPHNPQESNYANNTLITTATFDPVPKLHLVIASQPYILNNTTYQVSSYHRWKSVDWLYRAYPLSQIKVYWRTLPTLQASRKLNKFNTWDLTYPTCDYLNLYQANYRFGIFGSTLIPKNTAFYTLVPDDAGFMRGCAYVGGMITNMGFARTGSGPVGSRDWGWDFDGSYADWYTGHEVGHAFGRPHVRGGPGYVKDGCGGEAKAVTHYPAGYISPTTDLFDPNAIFGFDSLRLAQGITPILGPNWSDVMTYCDYQWISKITYMKLKEAFEFYLPQQKEMALDWGAAPNAVYPVLAVFGTLDPSSGAVDMLPIFVLSSETEIVSPDPGPYTVILFGADGDELAHYPFTPNTSEAGPDPNNGFEDESASISLLLPDTAGIASLTVEGPMGEIYQVEAGLNLPAVQVTSPNGGEMFGEESITVSWTASDEDGDPLTFNVEYSADNGNSWEPVAQFITENQVIIDQINLPASDMGLFRVLASDGIHTAMDSSDGFFFIPNHLPVGEIVTPASGTTIASDQTIAFQGQVYDYDLGTLDDANLQWWSDRDGLLGNGASFSTASLSQGLHEINLVADDGQGQYLIGQVIVDVVSTPNDLPPQPDALIAGPDLVFLYPTNGVPEGTIYLDNQNLGVPIGWLVTSDADWVEPSADSGITPQDITVTTSLTESDFGTHKALLTFSDPTGQYEPVYIVLIVTIPEYNVYLPLLVR